MAYGVVGHRCGVCGLGVEEEVEGEGREFVEKKGRLKRENYDKRMTEKRMTDQFLGSEACWQ